VSQDISRFAGLYLAAGAVGLIVGQISLLLWIATLLYVIWQHRNLHRLLRWLQHRKQFEPPEVPGIYEALCREIDFWRERHKKRKKKLADYIKQFQEAAAALPDATVVTGSLGDIQWANAAAAEYLGIYWPQDAQQRITNLVRHPELPKFLGKREAGESTIEIPSPVKQGAYLSLRVVAMGKDQRLFVARDVTRLHRLNEIRKDFVTNVSHELRTPVTVLSGYLETLNTDRDCAPEAWHPVIDHMLSQTTRMKYVIEDLLLLSRLEQEDSVPKPSVVSVAEMLNSIYQEAQALDGKRRHMFSLELDPDLLIIGSPTELYSAFSNLVVNAVHYTPENGVIWIRWYRDAQGAHMEVTDMGIGIPAHHIPRITERFYRVDQSRSRESGGTGLGLAIVKHILIRHKARLHIESTVGKGSTFRCDFPAELVATSAQEAQR
jgi:two-component system, OmpR family, phosphate regulon sensor histidine kinase PhoR